MTKKEIRNVLLDVSKEDVTAKNMFLSKAYSDLIKNIIEGICRKFGIYRAEVTWEDPNVTACTNGKVIKANANCLFLEGESLINKHYLFVGGVLHEIGHLLFTDFNSLFQAVDNMAKYNRLTPAPDTAKTNEAQNLIANKCLGRQLAGFLKDLNNITEDGYIEPAVMKYCRGYAGCLQKRREKKFSKFSVFDPKAPLQSSITNLVLQYAIMRQIKVNPEDEDNEVVVFAKTALFPLVDRASTEHRFIDRQKWTNELFAEIILYLIKKMEDNPEEFSGEGAGSGASSSSEDSSDTDTSSGSGSSSGSEKDDGSEENDGSEETKGESDSNENDSDSDASSSSKGSSDTDSSDNAGDSKSLSDEDIASAMENLTSAMDTSMQNAGEENTTYSNTGFPHTDSASSESDDFDDKDVDSDADAGEEALKSIKDAVNKEKAERECDSREEKEAQAINQKIVDSDDICAPHTHCSFFFHTKTTANKRAEELYAEYHEELDILGKRAAKLMARELQELQIGDTLTGLYSGRVTSRQLYRCDTDKKAFSKKLLPTDQPDIEILVMIDASGSMRYYDRDIPACKAGYAIWSFCRNFGIPVSVYNHTTEDSYSGECLSINMLFNGENIYGKKDGSSIFNIPKEQNNVDGYAYRWAVDKISLSSAKDKIIIYISDGEPFACGYRFKEGVRDIGKTLPLARKRGIHTITCAVDNTADEVKEVWCNSSFAKKDLPEFMDVSDLSTLPKTLINAIKPCIEKYL